MGGCRCYCCRHSCCRRERILLLLIMLSYFMIYNNDNSKYVVGVDDDDDIDNAHDNDQCLYFSIAAERKTSMGKDWHPGCLKCGKCSKTLAPGSHSEVSVLHRWSNGWLSVL